MAADDKDETGKPIDNSGLTPKPHGARTGSPVPPGVAPTPPYGRNFYFTAEMMGIGTMFPQNGGNEVRQANPQRQPPDNRPVFNPTGDAEVDAHYADESRLIREDRRIHTQLDKDNRIDEDGRDLDQSLVNYRSQHPVETAPDEAQFDRFNAPSEAHAQAEESRLERFNAPPEAKSPPDEGHLDRFNEPGARQVPERSPDDDGPGQALSDEFNRRGGPGG